MSSTSSGFSTDRAILSSLFPHDHPPLIEGMGMENLRYTHDLRYLRVDFSFTPNGRDIMVPFRLNYFEYENLESYRERRLDPKPRQHFFFAPCNEMWSDRLRKWREKGYNFLSSLNMSDSIVVQRVPESEFKEALMTSDFLFVFPGDYPVSYKMYKAILSGCIPVIFISSISDLPFIHFMDWSTFSIVVEKDILNSKEAMKSLVVLMERIRADSHLLARMRNALYIASHYFDWRRMTFPSPYHMVLSELEITTTKSRRFIDQDRNSFHEKLATLNLLNKFMI
jgi:hypothetical protein